MDRPGCDGLSPQANEPSALEARVAISGTADGSDQPNDIRGELTLLFTDNISGVGCTDEQMTDYPDTGASFTYTATRTM